MTTELLDQRIQKLQAEQKQLTEMHQGMVAQFQKTVAANQTRYAQIIGALSELNDLKKEMNGSTP